MTAASTPKTRLDSIEQLAKIMGLIAIPVLLAWLANGLQQQLASENLSRDYVQMAVGILKEEKRNGDDDLRRWAIDLLNTNSPNVKFNASVALQLQRGDVVLPVSSYNYTSPTTSGYNYTLPTRANDRAASQSTSPR